MEDPRAECRRKMLISGENRGLGSGGRACGLNSMAGTLLNKLSVQVANTSAADLALSRESLTRSRLCFTRSTLMS